jgi:hypothetical protein
MNAFLQTRCFRRAISFSPEEFRVEYTRAYSILPGKIHVEGLSIRGSDGAVEWILKLDRCDFRVQFLDLLHRQFHADHVRGSGLSMRLRLRLKQEEATPDVVAALPPVPGFSDPPYLEIGVPTLPPTDVEYKLWSVRLDDVDAEHVREIWIHTLRYAGDMRVRGRWLFRPVRWLEVGPATVDVNSIDISYGPTSPLFTGLRGSIETTVHPFDVRKPDGTEILRYVSLDASLLGSAHTAELLDLIAPASLLKVTHAEGPMDLRLLLDHGALRPGSRVSTSCRESEASAGELSIYAGIGAELRVESGSEPPIAQVDVGVSNLRFETRGVELARASGLSIRIESRDIDLAKPSIETASFAVQIQRAQAPTVAFLRPFLPARVTMDSGALQADGHLDGRLADERGHGQLGFTLRELSVARDANRVRANVQGVVKIESGSVRNGDVDLTDSRIALEEVVATVGGVHLRAPTFGLHAIRAAIPRDGRPDLDVEVDLPRADLTDLRDALPHGSAFSVAGAASASMHVDANVSSLSAHGSANLFAPALRVQVGSDIYQGELKVALQARNLDPKTTILSGSTLTFTSGSAPSTKAWWTRVRLGDAALRLAEEARFRATVDMTAENASPVQALLAKVTPVPRWALDAFPTENLHADGEIRGTPSSFEARSVVATASGTSVQLEYAKHDSNKEGMVLLTAGSLRVGLTLAGPGEKFQLFGAERSAETWFGRQVAVLRAHEDALASGARNPLP